MPKKENYTVKWITIADDMRTEDNGKRLIIGMYEDVVIVPALPYVMPTFAARFDLTVEKLEYTSEAKPIDSKGQDLASAAGHRVPDDQSARKLGFSLVTGHF